jgi:hypothetical protein
MSTFFQEHFWKAPTETAAGCRMKYVVQESGLWFRQQTWQAYKLDIYYGNKILLWGKQIISFEEAALL